MKLFDPLVPEDRWHPNFRNMMTRGNGFDFDVLNEWSRGFPDRDGKFVEEFQTTFNSSFWELYVFAVLKKYGMAVDFSQPRPDFWIPAHDLIIEAAIAAHAQGAEPEHARLGKLPPSDLNAFNMKTIVRLSNAIAAKHQKYLKSYVALEHLKGKPFVLAVANFDQPYSFLSCQRPIEAVLHAYYVDEERYLASGRQEGRLEGEELHRVLKENGSPIDLGMFSSPAYREISAVIFSGCASMGKVRALSSDPNSTSFFSAFRFNPNSDKPHVIQQWKRDYEEHLLDGLRVYHNPYALHPIDVGLFRHEKVFQSYWRDDDWVYENREGLLLNRHLMTYVDRQGEPIAETSPDL